MRAVVFLLVSLLSLSAFAQTTWKVDPVHSSVEFKVKHLLINNVTGSFDSYEISMQSSSDDHDGAAISASIDAASINTEQERRDNHLRSDDFFNAESFPTITLKNAVLKKTGDDEYEITGDLTIRETTKKVTFEAEYGGMVTDGWGLTRTGWEAEATIDRFDYGLKYNKMIETGGLVVGDKVKIILNLSMVRQDAKDDGE